jgi:protein regulator of cytokinesis 1
MAEAPVTISAVLNALHEHLQTQTQLLPTLHAQLGLPPSALTDELSALQQKLAETVEKQIEGRREEVENWMKKCDDIERDCLRRNKALGASSKSIGASVGELRKQQVLPVRYEMLNQYQEKLNQVSL